MSVPAIAVINESTVISDADVADIVAAIQIQLDRDFAPNWNGMTAQISLVAKGQAPDDAWQLVILDDSDQAGALGYHDMTKADLPMGKVFAKTDLTYDSSVSVTISHEVLEMVADPWISNLIFDQQRAKVVFYAYEVCDACEADTLGYGIEVNGKTILVSDFVFPAWFQRLRRPKRRYDFMGHLTSAFSLARGGYIGMWVPGVGWTQKTDDKADVRSRGDVGSRRERRALDREEWLRSVI